MHEGWGPLDPWHDGVQRRQIGSIEVEAVNTDGEWQFRWLDVDGIEATDPISEPEWTRIICDGSDTVHLRPALPDRPVVIRPRSPIVIPPGRNGQFYFSVPLWIRLVAGSDQRAATLLEFASRRLSSTWFGDMVSGQLCYAVDTRLLREMPQEDSDETYARCEIEIKNASRENLRFERLCVHVEHMHLYADIGKFWSNPVRVVFKGEEQVSQLSYMPGPPTSVPSAVSVCEPREAQDKNIFKRSFNLIREITGI